MSQYLKFLRYVLFVEYGQQKIIKTYYSTARVFVFQYNYVEITLTLNVKYTYKNYGITGDALVSSLFSLEAETYYRKGILS